MHDPYAAKIDYKDSRRMVGANYSNDATYLFRPYHHYDVIPLNYDRHRRCQYALRLTDADANSVGQVTYKIKQTVAFGFQTDFSV